VDRQESTLGGLVLVARGSSKAGVADNGELDEDAKPVDPLVLVCVQGAKDVRGGLGHVFSQEHIFRWSCRGCIALDVLHLGGSEDDKGRMPGKA